jgi:Na+/H+ antiporter NhaD/arsenite permease-like protein
MLQGISSVFGQHCDMNGDSLADSLCSSSIILLLSNLCSNVPTVMLLATKVEDMALDDAGGGGGNLEIRTRVAWLILAWASTVAGNFTLTGSIANLIVAERAALHDQSRPTGRSGSVGLTFWAHFRYASWTTIPIMLLGSAAIHYTHMPHGPATEPGT